MEELSTILSKKKHFLFKSIIRDKKILIDSKGSFGTAGDVAGLGLTEPKSKVYK